MNKIIHMNLVDLIILSKLTKEQEQEHEQTEAK